MVALFSILFLSFLLHVWLFVLGREKKTMFMLRKYGKEEADTARLQRDI